MLYLSRTKMTWLISICMHGHCGTGAPNFSWIQILCPNFIGMLRSILSTTASNLSDSSMSLGLQMHGGNYRFVESQRSSYFALLLTSLQVDPSSRWSSFLYPYVRRQDKVIVIWDSEGLPRSCPLCKFTCCAEERRRC